MDFQIAIVGTAVALFVATNVDDMLLLLGYLSDARIRMSQVVIGQYLGIATLFTVSAIASLLTLVFPAAYIGLLGVIPILIGVRQLYRRLRRFEPDQIEAESNVPTTSGAIGNVLSVAVVTVANGGDNVTIYTPLFAARAAPEIAVIGVVFVVMTAAWCAAAHWLVRHPALGISIQRYSYRLMPFVLIGVGILVLSDTGTLGLIALSPRD